MADKKDGDWKFADDQPGAFTSVNIFTDKTVVTNGDLVRARVICEQAGDDECDGSTHGGSLCGHHHVHDHDGNCDDNRPYGKCEHWRDPVCVDVNKWPNKCKDKEIENG